MADDILIGDSGTVAKNKINAAFAQIAALEATVGGLTNPMSMQGGWDASSGVFPGAGTAQNGFYYYVTVAGTVDGVAFTTDDSIIAITDNASTTTYAANWFKSEGGTITDASSVDADPAPFATPSIDGTNVQEILEQMEAAILARGQFPSSNKLLWGYTGQSLCTGMGYVSAGTLITNPKIFDLRAATPPQTGPFTFHTATPEYVSGCVGTTFVGMAGKCQIVGEGSQTIKVNTVWIAADIIQRKYPEIEIYLVNVHRVDSAISYWATGAECEAAFSTAMTLACTLLSKPYADAIIWDQGTSDISRAFEDYVTDAIAFKTRTESVGYAHVFNTRRIVLAQAQTFYLDSTYWAGEEAHAAAIGADFVSSVGLPQLDVAHFTGIGTIERGRRLAGLIETSREVKQTQLYEGRRISWLWGMYSAVANSSTAIGFFHKLKNALTTTGAKIAQWESSDGSIAVGFDKDGWNFSPVFGRLGSFFRILQETIFYADKTSFANTRAWIEVTSTYLKWVSSSFDSAAQLNIFNDRKTDANKLANPATYGAQGAHASAAVGYRDGGLAKFKGGEGAATVGGNGGNAVLEGGDGYGSGHHGYGLVNRSVHGCLLASANFSSETVNTSTPQTHAAWNQNGESNGVTVDHTANIQTVLVAGLYELVLSGSFTTNPASKAVTWTFQAGGVTVPNTSVTIAGNSTLQTPVTLRARVRLAANDVVKVQHVVESGTTSILMIYGQLTVQRISD